MMPEQDNISGQNAQGDTPTDRDLFLQWPATGIEKEQVGPGSDESWKDGEPSG
jgi:hypothetical protein